MNNDFIVHKYNAWSNQTKIEKNKHESDLIGLYSQCWWSGLGLRRDEVPAPSWSRHGRAMSSSQRSDATTPSTWRGGALDLAGVLKQVGGVTTKPPGHLRWRSKSMRWRRSPHMNRCDRARRLDEATTRDADAPDPWGNDLTLAMTNPWPANRDGDVTWLTSAGQSGDTVMPTQVGIHGLSRSD